MFQKPKLQFVWFEIVSDDCNESCIHCYADSMPPAYRKAVRLAVEEGSLNSGQTNERLSVGKWKNLIEEAYLLGSKRCQFIGGEPFLYKGENGETVLDLAEHARKTGYEFIEIFTNGTLLTQRKIDRIKSLGLNVAVSLYSVEVEVHDKITNTPGSHKKTIEALRRLKEANISTRVEVILMRLNEHTVDQTQNFINEMGFSSNKPDVLRPKGRGDSLDLFKLPENRGLLVHG